MQQASMPPELRCSGRRRHWSCYAVAAGAAMQRSSTLAEVRCSGCGAAVAAMQRASMSAVVDELHHSKSSRDEVASQQEQRRRGASHHGGHGRVAASQHGRHGRVAVSQHDGRARAPHPIVDSNDERPPRRLSPHVVSPPLGCSTTTVALGGRGFSTHRLQQGCSIGLAPPLLPSSLQRAGVASIAMAHGRFSPSSGRAREIGRASCRERVS